MIGQSSVFLEVLSRAQRMARSTSPVFIGGETGTGKEVIAQYIHKQGERSGPFIALNCAALPETLIESELFGVRRGAYTDARSDRAGLFMQANGGTLFLDEIGEAPFFLQAKLLRVLQEQEISPLGGEKAVPIDVRIITASNKNLPILTTERKFREDLFYRIHVLTIHLPPLRERGVDIELFMREYARFFGVTIEEEAQRMLCRYSWPGNIREMRNVIEQCAVISGPVIRATDLPMSFHDGVPTPGFGLRLPEGGIVMVEVLHEIEKRFVFQAIARTRGNKTAAGKLLGLPRSTVSWKLSQYGIETEAGDISDDERDNLAA